MKKILLFAVSALFAVGTMNAAEVSYNFNDYEAQALSIAYDSGDIFYFEAGSGRSGSHLCGLEENGVTSRIQQNHIIIYRPSTSLTAVTIAATSSSSSGQSRTVLSVETATNSAGEVWNNVAWTEVTGWISTRLPEGSNQEGTCGELELTGLDIATGTYTKITFTSWTEEAVGTAAQNIRLNEVTLFSETTGSNSVLSLEGGVNIHFNGVELVNTSGLNLQIYNTLGSLVRSSNATSVSLSDLQNGIYVVRAEGLKGALKISK